MITKAVAIREIEPGIRKLILNLGRLPRAETLSNCEGNIHGERLPTMPVKGGWFYLARLPTDHLELIDRLDSYCKNSKDVFNLEATSLHPYSRELTVTSVFGKFETYEQRESDGLFRNLYYEVWNPEQKKSYMARAYARKRRLIGGWNDMNQLVLNYIKEVLHQDPRKLPFRNPADKTPRGMPFRMCGPN